MPTGQKCTIDANGCLNLKSIVATFNAGLTEEQAWAVLFQASKTCASLLNTRQQLYVTNELHHILIHKDGAIAPASFTSQRLREPRRGAAPVPRKPASTESELVGDLGQTIYNALDYGLLESEEPLISQELEGLLMLMLSEDGSAERQETDDEGIERDSGESEDELSPSCSLLHVMQTCAQQIQLSTSAAESHYRAVCRALVAEALELSAFLELVNSKVEENHGEEAPPCPQEWARSWLDVMVQLRTGVALRHVETPEKGPVLSEMTPYEVLMEDIRLKRFTLNKVEGPSTKKDTQSVILEFIRSRPPLKKASERQLNEPPEKEVSIVEQLMVSIRSHDARSLRQAPSPSPTYPKSPLKKLEVDPSIFEDGRKRPLFRISGPTYLKDTDGSDTESYSEYDGHLSVGMRQYSRSPTLYRHTYGQEDWRAQSCHEVSRRHSLAAGPSGFSASFRRSRSPTPSFNQQCERLTLNLDEVVHIRSTLTRAELERVRVDPKTRGELLKGKICSCCLKVRFGIIFGPYAQTCRLCQRYVCTKCCFKANVPNTVFTKLPQWNLIPSPKLTIPRSEPQSLSPTLEESSVTSMPPDRDVSGPFSFSGEVPSDERRSLRRSFTLSRTDTLQMNTVCKDCKGLLHDLNAAASITRC